MSRQKKIGLIVRIVLQSIAFTIWAIELELETLFMNGTRRDFFRRLKVFHSKLAVRWVFLVIGGYHRVRLEMATLQCRKTQDAVLTRILTTARHTAFGRDLGFANIQGYDQYVQRVPIMTYAEHEPYIERQMAGEPNSIVPGRPLYYATTSGTTGKPKYIPVTATTAKRSHKDVSLIWAYYLARRNVGFLNEELLTITGLPVEGITKDGTPFGSTSGNLRKGLPRFMQRIYAVPEEVFTITDYDARYYCLALFSIRSQISHIASANPSTLVILFETIQKRQESLIQDIELGQINGSLKLDPKVRESLLQRLAPDPNRANELRNSVLVTGTLDPAFYWPRLASIGCWKGGNSPLFLERLRKIIPDTVPVFDLGYLASEIRATVPVERSHHGGVPTLHRNFFEFVPVEQWREGNRNTLRLHELKLGERYYILITTDSGLYRYHINDIVRVVGFFGDTPELVFEQKGDGVTNLTGEKLYEQQVQLAFASAAIECGTPLRFYMCVLNAAASRYEFVVELAGSGSPQQLRDTVDLKLGEFNIEYRSKRDSQRLAAPILHVLKQGGFEQYRAKRIKAGVREAQFKMVLLSPKIEQLADFEIEASYQGDPK